MCHLRNKNMVIFIGEYPSKVDDRGRLVFPSQLRGALPADGDQRFVIKKDLFQPCLQMFTFEEWESQSSQVRSRINFFDKEQSEFWREYMRNRDIVEPDRKLGRILISRKLLDSIGVRKDVVFSGNDFMIEIWARENFEKSGISNEKYITIAEKLPENR